MALVRRKIGLIGPIQWALHTSSIGPLMLLMGFPRSRKFERPFVNCVGAKW